jgi:WD40 repeat protein
VLHRFESHRTTVLALAFSPDSQILLTGGGDGVIRAWSTEDGSLIREHAGHAGEINALSFSTDGAVFVSASSDGSARVWSTKSGETLQSVSVPGAWMISVAISPDGSRLATSDFSITNSVALWEISSGAQERTLGLHVGQVWDLKFLPDGRLATAGDDRKVRVWNAQSGAVQHTLDGGPSMVNSLVVNSNQVIAGFASGSISVWNANTGAATQNFAVPGLWHLAAAPVSNRVVVVNSDFVVREWDLGTESATAEFHGHTTSTFAGLACSPDGASVVAGGTEPKVHIWNTLRPESERVIESSPSGTAAALLSTNGQRLLTTSGLPGPRLRLWDTESGALDREFLWSSGWPSCAAYSQDGARVAAGTMAGEVHLFDAATGARTTLSGHASAVRSVAFSPDGAWMASGDAAGAVRIWNQSGQWQRTLDINGGWVTAVAFSPTTNELMTASEDGLLQFWNPSNGNLLRTILVNGGFLESAVYSPNGRYVLAGEGWPFFTAELWDVSKGELLRVFSGHSRPVTAVAFTPDGLNALTGSEIVRLWDLADLLGKIETRPLNGGIELRWLEGTLQVAAAVSGPWNDLSEAASPWIRLATNSAGFFRIKLR